MIFKAGKETKIIKIEILYNTVSFKKDTKIIKKDLI
jgi:hypothetical protein